MISKSVILVIAGLLSFCNCWGQYPEIENELDKKVKAFLKDNAENWSDMNVPLVDGKILYDLIISWQQV